MRRIGPRLRGHRRALEQIAIAFPEKSPEERERIAIGMWDNLARTAVEYTQLDKLWRHDPARSRSAAASSWTDAKRRRSWTDIKACEPAHAALLASHRQLGAVRDRAAAQYGLKSLIPYRRLKNQTLTEELVRMRTAAGITPLAVAPSILSEIRKEFGEGDAMGMLIDQCYMSGIEVTFFGRPTKFNPLFARLVRIYDCPVYGSRIIRRDDGRFGYEIVGPLEPARDERGRVDVHATDAAVHIAVRALDPRASRTVDVVASRLALSRHQHMATAAGYHAGSAQFSGIIINAREAGP